MAGRPVTTRGPRGAPATAKGRAPEAPPHDHAALIAAWPGPAAILSTDGTVLSANVSSAELLAELTARAGQQGLADMVAAACADGQARTDTIIIPARPANLTYDVS